MIAAVLAEDVGAGDVTTDAIVPEERTAVADIVIREPGVVCGLAEAAAGFRELDPAIRVEAAVEDGTAVGGVPFAAARLTGSARAILTGERTALNLLQRMSGIATADPPLRAGGRGHRLPDPRHAEDGARATGAGQAGGPLRRRHQPPLRTRTTRC